METTQSRAGAVYKDRDSAVVSGTATTIIQGVTPPMEADGLTILFSMSDVAAWATGRLEIFNNGVSVWIFEDQFLTLLEPFFLPRNVSISDKYSAVLTQSSGAPVEAAVQIGIERSILAVHD